MTKEQLNQLGKNPWDIANHLRGALNAGHDRTRTEATGIHARMEQQIGPLFLNIDQSG